MDARIQDLPFDPAALKGLPDKLLRSHHQNNYGGAVKRHGLAAAPEPMVPAMALALAGSFGSVERWREEFVAMGKALAGGSGWVLLVFQPREGTLVNQWAADHTHAVAGGVPILALEMYEHAYHLDLGAAAGQYVEAFMQNIHWQRVDERYQAAVEAAQWRDPGRVEDRSAQLPKSEPVVVYCVYGHEVGRSTAMRLRAAGVDARLLRGGIDGWQSAGRPLAARQG